VNNHKRTSTAAKLKNKAAHKINGKFFKLQTNTHMMK